MHILLGRIHDVTIEAVVVLLWLRHNVPPIVVGARLYSTRLARSTVDFDRREEWHAKPAFCMELLKLSRINDIGEFTTAFSVM